MNDTDLLRGLLEQAAPTRPDVDPTSRAASVARRGRQARVRDRALVAAAAVSVVAVVVAIPRSVGGDDGPDVATPAPPAAVEIESCPSAPVNSLDHLYTTILLDDVVAVRSCPVMNPGSDELPARPLTGEDAENFAQDVEALPDYRLPAYCAAVTMPPSPWALQFQGSDGELDTIAGPVRDCSAVGLAGDRGSAQVIAAFLGNLQRQESGIPPLTCPTGDRLADGAPTWNASFDPSTATAGVVCYRGDPMGSTDYDVTEAPLDEARLTAIVDDLTANREPTPVDGMCTDTGPQRMVLLADADGDQAAWVDDRCTGEFAGPGGWWTPSQAAEQAYADALS